MNKARRPFNLTEAKIQASILLKSIHSEDLEMRFEAAKRFQKLPEFTSIYVAEIPLNNLKLKHALAVIALEYGFASWTDLKVQQAFIVGGFLNKWFTSYLDAKMEQQKQSGFLFPYKNQFFICESGYIERLGLDPNDPDWQAINWDWVKPADKKAWQRLYKKMINKKIAKK